MERGGAEVLIFGMVYAEFSRLGWVNLVVLEIRCCRDSVLYRGLDGHVVTNMNPGSAWVF